VSGNIFRKWFASYFLFIHEHFIITWSPTVNIIAVTKLLLTSCLHRYIVWHNCRNSIWYRPGPNQETFLYQLMPYIEIVQDYQSFYRATRMHSADCAVNRFKIRTALASATQLLVIYQFHVRNYSNPIEYLRFASLCFLNWLRADCMADPLQAQYKFWNRLQLSRLILEVGDRV